MTAHKNDEYIESLNVQIDELYLKLDTLYYACEYSDDYKALDIRREINKYENKILMLSNKIRIISHVSQVKSSKSSKLITTNHN